MVLSHLTKIPIRLSILQQHTVIPTSYPMEIYQKGCTFATSATIESAFAQITYSSELLLKTWMTKLKRTDAISPTLLLKW
jgi:hypothetical protein